jgi:GT2 family glycosyltransferase
MRIAVITPTISSRAELLKEAVSSVEYQTLKPAYHVVAEDTEGIGPGRMRNKMVASLPESVDWIAFLDDDDILFPNHLEFLAQFVGDADIIYTPNEGSLAVGPINPETFEQVNCIAVTVLMRRSAFEAVGGFRDTKYEDWDLFVRLWKNGARFKFINCPTWIYREFPDSRNRQSIIEDSKVSICVLGKYPEVFEKFLWSVCKYEPDTPKVFVRDGHDIEFQANTSWEVIQGHEPFSMAGNGNLALKAAPKHTDVLYCGDDIRFTAHTTAVMYDQAHSDPSIGILSPQIFGRGSRAQVSPTGNLVTVDPIDMWFPCVYFKREMLDDVGYLDEQFNEFGSDDYDLCLRAVRNGWRLAVTNQVQVIHESSPDGGPTTFAKKLGEAEWQRQQKLAFQKVRAKHRL